MGDANFPSPPHSRLVIPRECGGSSTPRPVDSITAVSGILDRPVKPGDDSRIYSRGMICPSSAISLSSLRREGAGKAGRKPHPQPGGNKKSPPVSPPRVQPVTPAFPAQWFDGLLRALPGERPLLSPLPSPLRDGPGLTPGSRRQDHTTSPYAAGVSSGDRIT